MKVTIKPITGKPVKCSNRKCRKTAEWRITVTPGYTMLNYCIEDIQRFLKDCGKAQPDAQ